MYQVTPSLISKVSFILDRLQEVLTEMSTPGAGLIRSEVQSKGYIINSCDQLYVWQKQVLATCWSCMEDLEIRDTVVWTWLKRAWRPSRNLVLCKRYCSTRWRRSEWMNYAPSRHKLPLTFYPANILKMSIHLCRSCCPRKRVFSKIEVLSQERQSVLTREGLLSPKTWCLKWDRNSGYAQFVSAGGREDNEQRTATEGIILRDAWYLFWLKVPARACAWATALVHIRREACVIWFVY